MTLSTHVLDAEQGGPGVGLGVEVARREGESWRRLGGGATDCDGRLQPLGPGAELAAGIYRLTFDTGSYFAASGRSGFYPEVVVTFEVTDPHRHHHVPLLLSPYSYTTYRGS
jgi:5-hydroxyisourate hydrolase